MSTPKPTPARSAPDARSRAEYLIRKHGKYQPGEQVPARTLDYLTPRVDVFDRRQQPSLERAALTVLLRARTVLSDTALNAELANQREAATKRRERAEERAGWVQRLRHDTDEQDRLIAIIRAHRSERGTGPAWSVVTKQMGWPRWGATLAIPALRRDGVVTYSKAEGSLDVTQGSEGR